MGQAVLLSQRSYQVVADSLDNVVSLPRRMILQEKTFDSRALFVFFTPF